MIEVGKIYPSRFRSNLAFSQACYAIIHFIANHKFNPGVQHGASDSEKIPGQAEQ